MRRPRLAVFLLGIVLLLGAGGRAALAQVHEAGAARVATTEAAPRHAAFSRLLARFVDGRGQVDYAGLKQHANTTLTPYLQWLATTDPSGWTRAARLAFWINAYNAHTLKLIIDHYPVRTIWALTPGPATPQKEQSPFQMPVGPVADTVRTLDEIEHEIIRVRFKEPRIHYAVVCAARSCPPLRRSAYTGPRLDAQLDDQARSFLHNAAKNRIPTGPDELALSRILKWYGSDFGPTDAALQRALAPYFDGRVKRRLTAGAYDLRFLPYDWTLNDQGSE
jgi:hypothetical protein